MMSIDYYAAQIVERADAGHRPGAALANLIIAVRKEERIDRTRQIVEFLEKGAPTAAKWVREEFSQPA